LVVDVGCPKTLTGWGAVLVAGRAQLCRVVGLVVVEPQAKATTEGTQVQLRERVSGPGQVAALALRAHMEPLGAMGCNLLSPERQSIVLVVAVLVETKALATITVALVAAATAATIRVVALTVEQILVVVAVVPGT